MSVFRVNKNKDYTTMSNFHLKDKRISLKAKGLLSEMLSLPDDWNYTIEGLASINKESAKQIKLVLNELKQYQYLYINKLLPNETKTGRIEYVYDIYEIPKTRVPKQGGCFQGVENRRVVSGDNKELIQNTNILNTNKYNIYGEFKNVKLTDEEYKKLEEKNLLPYIEKLSSYMASKGKRYKSQYATILNWSRKEVKGKEEIIPDWFDKDLSNPNLASASEMNKILKEIEEME